MTYYNTTEQTGEELQTSHQKTKKQDELIYECFLSSEQPLSPSMVLNNLNLNCPITSVRRAITNLTKDGLIEKTNQYVEGNYGAKEHLWKLTEASEEVQVCLSLFATAEQP